MNYGPLYIKKAVHMNGLETKQSIMKKNRIHPLKTIGQGLPLWMQIAARLPFLFLFAAESITQGRNCRMADPSSKCRSVSVIIPTLNEEQHIVRCIRSVSGNRHLCEIIVVDAGSGDQTREIARQAGARIIVHDKPVESGGGRGGQIKAGIHAASGDVVAVVHADTLLPGSGIDRLMDVLNRCPDIAGGAVGGRFDSPRRRYRFLELANHFRAGFFKISFGDQVQFFRREPVVAHDLFPDIPIMEDVEFSIRLRRVGRVTYLFGNVLFLLMGL